jgi:hypothetical protein
LKFVDATLQIQESVSEEKYFKFVYYIKHVDIKSIIEKKIRENVYANNLRNEKYNTSLIRKHSNLLKTSKRSLNMVWGVTYGTKWIAFHIPGTLHV